MAFVGPLMPGSGMQSSSAFCKFRISGPGDGLRAADWRLSGGAGYWGGPETRISGRPKKPLRNCVAQKPLRNDTSTRDSDGSLLSRNSVCGVWGNGYAMIQNRIDETAATYD